jgi:hypothetical protein
MFLESLIRIFAPDKYTARCLGCNVASSVMQTGSFWSGSNPDESGIGTVQHGPYRTDLDGSNSKKFNLTHR